MLAHYGKVVENRVSGNIQGDRDMFRICTVLVVVVLTAFSQTTYAVPFTFEARSLGMGSVATATANLATAAWANPAMLTNQPVEDDWSLLIGIGAFVRDDDELLDDIDDFQDADESREAAIDAGDPAGALQSTVEMRQIIAGIEDKAIAPEATALIAMGVAFESFAMAVSVRADAIAGGAVTNISCSLIESGCDPGEIFSEEFNILNVDGVLATEIGVSFAKDFQVWDRKLSIGVKPKIVELDVFTSSESILTVDTDNDYAEDQDNKESLDSFETIDVGLAMDLSDSVRLGLNVRNLITDDFEVFDQTLNFDTETRLGIAYYNKFLTVAADLDLTENEPLLPNETFAGLRTQYLAIGAEFNAFDYLKFRLGVRKNVASDISSSAEDPVYTAGIGLWFGFNIDIAAIANDHTAGAFLQTGFQF
jgi:hypothetical protein